MPASTSTAYYYYYYSPTHLASLRYYASHLDCPLFSGDRGERNMIDLSKVTLLRARTKQKDVRSGAVECAA